MDKQKAILILEAIRTDYICPCECLEEEKKATECKLYKSCSDAHDALVMAIDALKEDSEDDLR